MTDHLSVNFKTGHADEDPKTCKTSTEKVNSYVDVYKRSSIEL